MAMRFPRTIAARRVRAGLGSERLWRGGMALTTHPRHLSRPERYDDPEPHERNAQSTFEAATMRLQLFDEDDQCQKQHPGDAHDAGRNQHGKQRPAAPKAIDTVA